MALSRLNYLHASSNASYANDAFQRTIKDASDTNTIMFLIQQITYL